MPASLRVFAVAAICLAVSPLAGQAVDPSQALFARDRVLQIDIDLAAGDWREIRLSHRKADDSAMTQIAEDGAYTYRPADIRIDGVRVARVGVRKKGLLGSVVSTRPSLKVKFDEYVDGQTFSGLDGLTLNNNNQDQALVQTYLAYDLYARSGVPAPRANFAHVRVNGEDLGIYTHVEAVDKSFVRRVFGSTNGVIYESYAGDFVGDRTFRIVEKSGAKNLDRTRIAALAEVLAAPGPVSLARVEALVDLDTFMRMWAIESLMGHWDSYSANRNNFYLYSNATTGKLHFIPWGPDSVFADPGPLQPAVVPKSFKAMGVLCRRLWELPEVRRRYQGVMRELLAGPWNETRIAGDMSALQKVLQPQSTMLPATVQAASGQILAFLRTRRAEVERELLEPAPVWPAEATPSGTPVPMVISGTFSAPWSRDAPANPLLVGTAQMKIELGGKAGPAVLRAVANATTNKQGDTAPVAAIREKYQLVTLTGLAGDQVWQLSFTIDPFLFASEPASLPVDHYTTWAILAVVDNGRPKLRIFGLVGQFSLDEAVARDGGTVKGTFMVRGFAP